MSWQEHLKGDSLTWLLEHDVLNVRYLAMRDILNLPADDGELIAAQELSHREGPISVILDEMNDGGYWVKEGAGYSPKYRGTVWSLILLAQLGASSAMDKRIARACNYLIEHALTKNGQFSVSGTPSTTADCLQGNLCAALLDLGVIDPRMEAAFDWMARSVTGEGIAPKEEKRETIRYYAGKCGPGFACGANNKLPCAWGGVKVMLALSKIPPDKQTSYTQHAIKEGVEFFFSIDPATALYPSGWSDKPSGNWWKFGFPVFYVTDLLQTVEALVQLGYGEDPRLANALNLIIEKQDNNGRWPMEYSYTGKTWYDFGRKKQPNEWVTLRALKVLAHARSKGNEIND